MNLKASGVTDLQTAINEINSDPSIANKEDAIRIAKELFRGQEKGRLSAGIEQFKEGAEQFLFQKPGTAFKNLYRSIRDLPSNIKWLFE